jgi:hypothetical protein
MRKNKITLTPLLYETLLEEPEGNMVSALPLSRVFNKIILSYSLNSIELEIKS